MHTKILILAFSADVFDRAELARKTDAELYAMMKEDETDSIRSWYLEEFTCRLNDDAVDEVNNFFFPVDLDKVGPKESFVITRLSRADLEDKGFDTSNVTDGQMQRLADKMGDDYCEQLFWTSMEILAEAHGFPKKNR